MNIVFHVAAARPAEWSDALQLFLQDVDEDLRPFRLTSLLTLIESGEIAPEGILVARRDDRIIGVQVATPRPGAWGMIWPPRLRPGCADQAVEDALVQAGLALLRQRG